MEIATEQQPKKRTWQRWQLVYAVVLLATLGVSFIFQIGNIGWFLIILGILYLAAYFVHFGAWLATIVLQKRPYSQQHTLFTLNQLCLLIANILNVDFGDTHAYMFFMQYPNPPDWVVTVGIVSWGGWGVTLLIHATISLIIFLRNRNAKTETETVAEGG